jgi:hypothetical protein
MLWSGLLSFKLSLSAGQQSTAAGARIKYQVAAFISHYRSPAVRVVLYTPVVRRVSRFPLVAHVRMQHNRRSRTLPFLLQ